MMMSVTGPLADERRRLLKAAIGGVTCRETGTGDPIVSGEALTGGRDYLGWHAGSPLKEPGGQRVMAGIGAR
jgi:hypothetical protein